MTLPGRPDTSGFSLPDATWVPDAGPAGGTNVGRFLTAPGISALEDPTTIDAVRVAT